MRFSALLYKEIRELLPWLILVAAFFILFCTLSMLTIRLSYYHYNLIDKPGSEVDFYRLRHNHPLSSLGPLLFLTALGLGLVLAVRQFWFPNFFKTWAFTIHRSISRGAILTAKFTAAALSYISLSLLWTFFFWYVSRPGILPYPPSGGIYLEGMLLILSGVTIYFGACLTGLSSARWYTTRVFGLGFAVFITVLIWGLASISWFIVLMLIGQLLLLVQIIHTFLNKEF